MEIQKTTDYKLFKKLDGNRDVKRTNALVKSILEFDLTMYSPIIVSEDFRIIDGQHRFAACRELGLPIYYIVMCDNNVEKAMIVLNKCQSQWRNSEFFQYNVQKKGGVYAELKEYIDKNKINLSYAVILFPQKPFETKKVRDANFVFEKYSKCDELTEFYLSPEFKILPFWASKPFVRAIRAFFEKSDKKQLDKLKRKALAIPQCANNVQYITAFDNLVRMRR